MLNVVLILIILFVKMNFILVNVSIEKAILFFIFLSPTGVILKPKCLKVPILSPQHRMLHTGMSDYFEMTMHSYVLYSYINIYLDFIVSIVTASFESPSWAPSAEEWLPVRNVSPLLMVWCGRCVSAFDVVKWQ